MQFLEVWCSKYEEQAYIPVSSIKAIRPDEGSWDKATIVTEDGELYLWEHPLEELWELFNAVNK